MSDLEKTCAELVTNLGTRTDESAFHNLIELGPEILSILMLTFENEQRPAVRSRLVDVISEFRDPAAVEFLEHALDDPQASVWKASLDGLVTIGGPTASAALRRAQHKELASKNKSDERLEWIREALQQTGANSQSVT